MATKTIKMIKMAHYKEELKEIEVRINYFTKLINMPVLTKRNRGLFEKELAKLIAIRKKIEIILVRGSCI